MMSICIKLEIIKTFKFFFRKKMFPKRVYRSPCLMTFVDEMESLMINDIDGS